MRTFRDFWLLCVGLVFLANLVFAQDHPANGLLVIDAPSTVSAGTDSTVRYGALGSSDIFFGPHQYLLGLTDIACSPQKPSRIVISDNDYEGNISELLELNPSGQIIRRTPFGTPGGQLAVAFDRAGNLYAGEDASIFKNGVLFATLPAGSTMEKMAVDSRGNLYITSLFPVDYLYRVDPKGNVTVFADSSKGLSTPLGLAIDSMDNIFVANNPPSAPAFILRFDPSGNASPFGSGIAFQPVIRGMTFDPEDNLYAVLESPYEVLKFDAAGNSSVFADASMRVDLPVAIAICETKRGDEDRNHKHD